MKVLTVIGARPQFVKASALSREVRKRHQEVLLHTGQHYDYQMSGIFFDGLDLPPVDVNLSVGSGSHGAQTAAMLEGIEKTLISEKPNWVVILGDTNSTLAGSLAASKLGVPVAHVEAGLRSFNREMPEEINRVVADHLSNALLCPSVTAVKNLAAEGITANVHLVGDVMLDVLNWAKNKIGSRAPAILDRLGLKRGEYLVVTVHRNQNTDVPERLSGILEALNGLDETIIFPIHPRARKMINAANYRVSENVRLIEPLGYFDMISLMNFTRLLLTDSGGLQKEAYWLGIPCITLREETEWVETVECGWNTLAGAQPERIIEAVRSFAPPSSRPALYGDGNVAERCVDVLTDSTLVRDGCSAVAR